MPKAPQIMSHPMHWYCGLFLQGLFRSGRLIQKENLRPKYSTQKPQNHAKKRITTTNLVFDKFKYKADFKQGKNSDISTFLETFDNKDTGKIRQNEHTLYMPTQKSILAIAKDIGFILQGKIDMVSVEYEYQYLYILQKPE